MLVLLLFSHAWLVWTTEYNCYYWFMWPRHGVIIFQYYKTWKRSNSILSLLILNLFTKKYYNLVANGVVVTQCSFPMLCYFIEWTFKFFAFFFWNVSPVHMPLAFIIQPLWTIWISFIYIYIICVFVCMYKANAPKW